ncbi:acyl-CoA dehydrogenase [Nocardioides marmoriginsengisoli]|uniref:Acyl-[acyl-carrier-protein] dehydrogenase MbtN n=1 Tax=Nocardioides marmoriginsengisoli TaxID=661483 RepID=A0A3N0CHR0_9ACTN|nr:acyl-CoA dehydrogenase family protein [Nocardioides marmoriginsengisoli]RNL62801.1 acyl-CoA dehydrogenase [Nocardioides marmoriginsengisoli]
MERELFSSEHDDFRQMVRTFIEKEVVPHTEEWTDLVPREVFDRLGELGIIGVRMPEEFGGGGAPGFLYNAIIVEEAARALVSLGPLRCHMDIVSPYFTKFANQEQRERWFPGLASGELFSAIAMTEPDTGSDLAGIRTTARRDGDSWIVNGAKTFITGGTHADLVVTVARTSEEENRREGLSLLVVEAGMPGFEKGRRLPKIGLPLQDLCELSFNDVRVPAANLLGEEGQAFKHLTGNLAQERLSIAVGSVAAAQAALATTIDYVKERKVFGKPLATFQNSKFELAAVAAEIEAGQALVDRALARHERGELTSVDAAKAKLFSTELQNRAIDRCLQLFGGYGYITEYPIARLYADARVSRIYGGTSEVMKSIISKSIGL